MGILDWMYQGTLNVIHPAATVLILVALATAFFVRKGFCSWVCPVGFLSEIVARFGDGPSAGTSGCGRGWTFPSGA
jgi:polyferredoxin